MVTASWNICEGSRIQIRRFSACKVFVIVLGTVVFGSTSDWDRYRKLSSLLVCWLSLEGIPSWLSLTLHQLHAAAAQTYGRSQKLQAILEESHRAPQHLHTLEEDCQISTQYTDSLVLSAGMHFKWPQCTFCNIHTNFLINLVGSSAPGSYLLFQAYWGYLHLEPTQFCHSGWCRWAGSEMTQQFYIYTQAHH